MAGRVYVRDLEVLRNLDEGLSKFNHGATDVLEQVARGIRASQEHLRSRTNYWQAELRRREDALRACESARDDKGRGYDCRAEVRAVHQAHEALEKLRKLSSGLEQAIGEYSPYASRLQQLLDAKMNKAKGNLNRSVQKYQGYLAQSGPSSRNVGASSSGSVGKLKSSPSSKIKLLVNRLQKALPPDSRGRVTMAAGVIEDKHGNKQTVIATSELRGYIRRGVKEKIPSEAVVVDGNGHAEANIIDWANHGGKKVITVGAGRPICSSCAHKLAEVGSEHATPLKDIK